MYPVRYGCTDSDLQEMRNLLDEIEKNNEQCLLYYPELEQLDVESLRERVDEYETKRRELDAEIEQKEKALGRSMEDWELIGLEEELNRTRKSLHNDLTYTSAGVNGFQAVFDLAGEYDDLLDELGGVFPAGYEDISADMGRLSKRDRYEFLDKLKGEGKIDGFEYQVFKQHFIDRIPEPSNFDGEERDDIDPCEQEVYDQDDEDIDDNGVDDWIDVDI